MDQVTEVSLYRPKPSDLIAFLPFACRQLEAPFHLRILVETIEEYASKSSADDKGKRSKRDKTPQAQASAGGYSADDKEASPVERDYGDENEVVLRARCDAQGRPVELLFHRCARVPRLLVKIIGLCIPYHERLAKIVVRWVPLDGAALYEIAKFLPLSQLTEIRLDDSPVPHRIYHSLLEVPSRLSSLSLARCGLADEECAALAVRLAHPLPASRTLTCLSLESNRIRDEGACAIGHALRSNRSLRHLNLAGNAITSLGAAHVLRSLAAFPVSSDEMLLKRSRTFDYLKLRREAYTRCYRELTRSAESARSRPSGAPRSGRASAAPPMCTKGSGSDALVARAEAMAADVVGARADPFDPVELVTRDGVTHCAGNFTLTYLNLAYNELDSTSAGRLAEVLAYQARAGRRSGPGLVRAVLEGNALPDACDAARIAEGLLERALDDAGGAGSAAPLSVKAGRKNERPKYK